MSVARDGCAAVCIEGNVYVVGGSDGCTFLKSAEMYDPSAGQWRALPGMRTARDAWSKQSALHGDSKNLASSTQDGHYRL